MVKGRIMTNHRRRTTCLTIVAASSLLLLGCQTLLQAPDLNPRSALEGDRLIEQGKIALPAVSQPTKEPGARSLHPGDSFTYDNPNETWTVVEISAAEIVWRSDSGGRRVTPYEPGLPAILWNDAKRVGRRALNAVHGSLLPPAVGKRIDFMVEGQSDRPPARWSTRWSCEIKGVQEIKVKAGKAKTHRIECSRNGVLEAAYFYSAKVGHYVYVVSYKDGTPKIRQLTAYKSGARKAPKS